VVIFTSFRPDKVKGFADGASGAVMRLYMPPWTVEETVACINSWSGFAISEAEVRLSRGLAALACCAGVRLE
jgi:hypothetical protein